MSYGEVYVVERSTLRLEVTYNFSTDSYRFSLVMKPMKYIVPNEHYINDNYHYSADKYYQTGEFAQGHVYFEIDKEFIYYNLQNKGKLIYKVLRAFHDNLSVNERVKRSQQFTYDLDSAIAAIFNNESKNQQFFKPEEYKPVAYIQDDEQQKQLLQEIPALSLTVTCPVSYDEEVLMCTPELRKKDTIWQTVQHLNDMHKWSREQIADWLDTLDADLSFGGANEFQEEIV